MSTTISVSIPDRLFRILKQVSREEKRSESYYVRKSLEQYLAHKLEEDYQDVVQALDEFYASGAKGKTWQELREELSL